MTEQPVPLFTPDRERVLTSNAWAFLHWLRIVHGIDLPDWAALRALSANDPDAFGGAILTFCRLPAKPRRLVAAVGTRVIFRRGPARLELTDDALAGHGATLPPDIAAPFARIWPPELLLRPLADALLHADLRPDDRVLIVGSHWPWLAAVIQGTTLILTPPTNLWSTAAEERVTVVIAPAALVAQTAFRRPRERPNLSVLRAILVTGGPMSPEERVRVYTWIKPDVMLLARSGDTIWGNPLEPVLARPPAQPGLFRPLAPDRTPPRNRPRSSRGVLPP